MPWGRIVDSIAWSESLLPYLKITHRLDHIPLHPTCSTTRLKLSDTLLKIATLMAERTEIPICATCCGTAGDRGLLHPELVRSATRDTFVQITRQPNARYVSVNRTCEIGMRQATGKPYESFVFTLEELTRPEHSSNSPSAPWPKNV
jgi:D-lactate dehydrogenase